MRIMLGAVAVALAVASTAPAQAPANPYAIVRTTPAGTFVHGSPAAKVKLVEWFSMTCPHCAHFSQEAGAEIDRRIRSGAMSLEYRHLVLNPADLAASLAARCGGATRFPGNARALFAAQPQWVAKAQTWIAANRDKLQGASTAVQLQQLARGAGIHDLMRPRGYTDARIDQCIADGAELKRLIDMTGEARKLAESGQAARSTPGFSINGAMVADVHSWEALKPRLIAAGAR